MLISFLFFPLKVRDYSPPLLVIKSVWQESSEVLWPSGHVAVAPAVLQTGLLAVMCYRAGDFKGLLQAYLKDYLGLTLSPKVRYQMAHPTKSKLIRSPAPCVSLAPVPRDAATSQAGDKQFLLPYFSFS